MTKQRLYHSQFNHHGWQSGKGSKSRAHNLRATEALKKLYSNSVELEEICDPDLIKNNLLIIDNKKVDPLHGDQLFQSITKTLEQEKKEYLEKIENAYTDSNKAELSSKRAKAKAALKRYAAGSDNEEKTFWNGLIEKLGSQKIDTEDEILKLKNTSDLKIKRFNQKVKRISELSNYDDLINVKSRNTEYTIFSKELLYKIPDDTDLKIKAIDLANFTNLMNKKLYPDFRTTYIVIHSDENPDRPHAHCEFSGLNLKTGEMDIQQQLFLNIEKQYKLKNKIFPLAGKTYNSLNNEEVKHFGVLYQDFIYEEMNTYLLKKGYNSKLEKRTEKEKNDDQKDFFENKKPTQKREFTRAKKLQEQNEKAKIEAKQNIEKQKKLESELLETEQKVEKAYKELSIVEKSVVNTKAALRAAIDFANNAEIKSLLDYKKHFQSIKNEVVQDTVKAKSIEIQPDEVQEEKIRNIRKRKF